MQGPWAIQKLMAPGFQRGDVVLGTYSYLTLPRESFPDIPIPYVFVTTTYEGVAPEDMEKLITIPIERKIKGISGLSSLTNLPSISHD